MTWSAADWPWPGEPWDFLGEPLAVDVANSLKRRGDVTVELWRTGADVAGWCAHEPGRVPALDAAEAGERLGELRALRDDVVAVLAAVAAGDALPAPAVARLDDRALAHPVVAQLGRPAVVRDARDAADELLARAAVAAIELAAAPDGLAFCDAPSCGQFFMRDRPAQRWCGAACGTRARVARHAARHRGG